MDDANCSIHIGVEVPIPTATLLPPLGEMESMPSDVVVANLELAELVVPQELPVLEISPVTEKVAQPAVPPALETTRLVVEALVDAKLVVVALVVVEKVAKRLVVEAVPLTSKVKFGVLVLIPTLPELRIVRIEEEAFETKFARIASVEVPQTVRVAYGVVVPTETRGFLIPPPPSDSE